MKKMKIALLVAATSCYLTSIAQSPISGFMNGKNKGSLVASYNVESYSKVFLVPEKVDGVPVFNKVDIASTSLFVTLGLSKKVDIQLNVPYIKTKGNASDDVLNNLNYQNERSGLQDISAYIKYNPYNIKAGKGNIAFIGSIGFHTPLSNYNVNEGLQSIIAIGNRATQLNAFIVSQFKAANGIFVTGSLGYSLRNNQVPNAFISELKAGYAGKNVYIDFYGASQISSKGVDILKEGFTGFFPATQVNYDRIGANIFVPIYKGFGIAGGAAAYVGGRNLGESTGGYGAVIYSF